jgi:hypothetical protein
MPFTEIVDRVPGGGACNDDINGDAVRLLTELL